MQLLLVAAWHGKAVGPADARLPSTGTHGWLRQGCTGTRPHVLAPTTLTRPGLAPEVATRMETRKPGSFSFPVGPVLFWGRQNPAGTGMQCMGDVHLHQDCTSPGQIQHPPSGPRGQRHRSRAVEELWDLCSLGCSFRYLLASISATSRPSRSRVPLLFLGTLLGWLQNVVVTWVDTVGNPNLWLCRRATASSTPLTPEPSGCYRS